MQNWWCKIKTGQLIFGICGLILLGLVIYFIVTHQENEDKELPIDTISTREITTDTKRGIEQHATESKSSKIYVDISGAVKYPGVYQLTEGARLFELLKQAGGLTEDAAIQTVNQAMIIQDQQKIMILTQAQVDSIDLESINNLEEKSEEKSPNETGKININQADLTQLQQLTGIGEKKAQAIIDYRNENGLFRTIEDLAKVTGIGEKTVEKLRNSITI